LNKEYLRKLLEVIRVNVIRCKWNVGWGVPYGPFTLSVTKELLDKYKIKYTDEDLVFASHYIATKLEMRGEKNK